MGAFQEEPAVSGYARRQAGAGDCLKEVLLERPKASLCDWNMRPTQAAQGQNVD
ncbi:hypothetical protein B0G75_1205 [Paraburkholderia sp. BL18I3N2]|nr:hypothetical protein B0G75_1205 [Paraburkholderia sp. BL18I3N2]PRX90738.1 hypothetical protein B0G73_14235 [Paraburkholderia sp. BL25I1N1]RKR31670.1 hypothetical protein B0G82_7891 [Paraburkholderia sp. BL17N1]